MLWACGSGWPGRSGNDNPGASRPRSEPKSPVMEREYQAEHHQFARFKSSSWPSRRTIIACHFQAFLCDALSPSLGRLRPATVHWVKSAANSIVFGPRTPRGISQFEWMMTTFRAVDIAQLFRNGTAHTVPLFIAHASVLPPQQLAEHSLYLSSSITRRSGTFTWKPTEIKHHLIVTSTNCAYTPIPRLRLSKLASTHPCDVFIFVPVPLSGKLGVCDTAEETLTTALEDLRFRISPHRYAVPTAFPSLQSPTAHLRCPVTTRRNLRRETSLFVVHIAIAIWFRRRIATSCIAAGRLDLLRLVAQRSGRLTPFWAKSSLTPAHCEGRWSSASESDFPVVHSERRRASEVLDHEPLPYQRREARHGSFVTGDDQRKEASKSIGDESPNNHGRRGVNQLSRITSSVRLKMGPTRMWMIGIYQLLQRQRSHRAIAPLCFTHLVRRELMLYVAGNRQPYRDAAFIKQRLFVRLRTTSVFK
ncbi:hypothetical protein SCHPADRAFT_889170 [Schizopora paradoxa]|uniref:Uncharacterized protein n=1 Tax=Schizopora paradoxa TaxID=27342 RepID=A0A0H2RRL7_9AGAM|nr:hypothetical protein SCHPADRAFT_889170 [Schizopora paradoxa]